MPDAASQSQSRSLERAAEDLGGYGRDNIAQFMRGDFSSASPEDADYLKAAIRGDGIPTTWDERWALKNAVPMPSNRYWRWPRPLHRLWASIAGPMFRLGYMTALDDVERTGLRPVREGAKERAAARAWRRFA